MKMKAIKAIIGIAATAMLLAGCTKTEVQYPKHLNGYWVSTPAGSNAYWYELDVDDTDSTQATLTYNQGMQALSMDMVTVDYDPTTGKGTLRTKGKHLPLQAKNDTTIVVTFAQTGETEMHLRVRAPQPETQDDMEGYWVSTYTEWDDEYIDEETVGLLIYPADRSGKTHLSMLANGFGMGADLTIDAETRSGSIDVHAGDSAYTMSFTTDYKTLILSAEGREMTYTRQARADEIALSMAGTWNANMMGMTFVAVIDQDNTCALRIQGAIPVEGYEAIDITLTGKVYYSIYAGRGVLELDDKNTQEIFEGENVEGISILFAALSPTKVRVAMEMNEGMTMNLDFTKK